jgi:hypothetical protein
MTRELSSPVREDDGCEYLLRRASTVSKGAALYGTSLRFYFPYHLSYTPIPLCRDSALIVPDTMPASEFMDARDLEGDHVLMKVDIEASNIPDLYAAHVLGMILTRLIAP